ncbi:MAG: MATE family efflux transporter [Candidatus Kapabacteria bacterium]|nr:MATE family efflux transporter [Candidatus Kapabacteria bacterium]
MNNDNVDQDTGTNNTPQRGRVDLLNSPIMKSLISFTIPLTFSFVVQMLYGLIDRWFISKLGTEAIAGIGIGEQLNFLIFTLGSGFCMGTGVIVARRIGEKDRDGADRTATQAIVFLFATTLILTAGLYVALPYVLTIFRANARTTELAHQYLTGILFGFAANLISFQINAIVRSTGNTVYPTIILLSTTLMNAILAPVFIFYWNLGMFGAGLATALAQLFGALVNISFLLRGKAGIHLRLDGYKPDFHIISREMSLGLPSSLQMIAVSSTRIVIFTLVSGFGTHVVAAYTLGISVDFMVFMFIFSIGIAVEIATGQNLGANKPERVFAYHRAGIEALAAIVLVFGIAVYLFGSHFVSYYTTDASVIREVEGYLHVSVFGYLFFAIGIVSARVISGAGAAYQSLFIVAGSIVGIQLPIVIIFTKYFGWQQTGIWIGAATGYFFLAMIGLVNVQGKKWLKVRV